MFFGWKNIKWFVREIIKLYSNEDSYFSKKRIESGFAFIVLEWGMIHWMIVNVDKIKSSELFIWASINAFIAGYMINQIQKEKKEGDIPPVN